MRWARQLSYPQRVYLGSFLLTAPLLGLAPWLMPHRGKPAIVEPSTVTNLSSESITITTPDNTRTLETPTPTPLPKPATSYTPASSQFLFGVGTELDHTLNQRITKEAPIKLLTSWYNGPNDLGFMNGWRNNLIPQSYTSGYALHLIIYSNDPEQALNTPYGAACGRPYPLSQQFLSDVQQLAQNFRGGKLYVSMFTEFQTYPCIDNTWAGGENYYKALQDQYLAALKIFHEHAEGSQISLSWGGWQADWDDAAQGGGLSLFKHFANTMNASDFQSFQAMATTSNKAIVTNMTKALKPYAGGVMVAHYKPDNGNQATFKNDLEDIFTPSNMAALQKNELFAFSFMDTVNMNSSETAYQAVRSAVKTYAR